jgi:Domain of unknown function (DUF3303)
MVIEKFKGGDARAVGERFGNKGRMLPEGITYHASWMDLNGSRCFQLMESPDEQLLRLWMSRWGDLVDFEVASVQSSAEFWGTIRLRSGDQ